MSAIRAVMNLCSYTEAALWLSQWRGIMRIADIIRKNDQKGSKWDPECDKNLDRISWKQVKPEEKHGHAIDMLWKLKQTKKHQDVVQTIFLTREKRQCNR